MPALRQLLIISNITSSFQPIEAMEKFYRLLRIMPFYHATNGYKIITHATRENHKSEQNSIYQAEPSCMRG